MPGAEGAAPPYELTPGTGRRGPVPLWERFDAAVKDLNRAITGSSAAVVADAFGECAEAASALADAVAHEDEAAARDSAVAGPRRGLSRGSPSSPTDTSPMPPVPRMSIHLPAPGTKRAVVIGAGSFGTAVAVLLARGGLRTTLQARTPEQAQRMADARENRTI